MTHVSQFRVLTVQCKEALSNTKDKGRGATGSWSPRFKKMAKKKKTASKKAAAPRKRRVRKNANKSFNQVSAKSRAAVDDPNKDDLSPTDMVDSSVQPKPKAKAAKKKLKEVPMPDPDRHFVTVEDEVAQDEVHLRNWYYPNASKYYPEPHMESMRRVTKYYPYAEGGPLAVDKPSNERELAECEKKRKVFLTDESLSGIRYCVVTKETEVSDIFDQFEGKAS